MSIGDLRRFVYEYAMHDEEQLADRIATMVVEKLSLHLESIVRALISDRHREGIASPAPKDSNPRWTRWWRARSAAGQRRITEVKPPNGTPGRKKYRAVLDCGHERRLAFYGVDSDDEDAPLPERPEDTVGMMLTCERCQKAYDAKHREPPRRG